VEELTEEIQLEGEGRKIEMERSVLGTEGT
jgi:hypothetical protein